MGLRGHGPPGVTHRTTIQMNMIEEFVEKAIALSRIILPVLS